MPNTALPENVAHEVSRICACLNLRKVTRSVTQIYDDALRSVNLRSGQYSILIALNAHDPCTIHQLSEIICVDRTSLSRNLKPLERRGLIEIKPGRHDKRTRMLNLTEKGIDKLHEAYPLWDEAQKEVTKIIGDDELMTLLDYLNCSLNKLRDAGVEVQPENNVAA